VWALTEKRAMPGLPCFRHVSRMMLLLYADRSELLDRVYAGLRCDRRQGWAAVSDGFERGTFSRRHPVILLQERPAPGRRNAARATSDVGFRATHNGRPIRLGPSPAHSSIDVDPSMAACVSVSFGKATALSPRSPASSRCHQLDTEIAVAGRGDGREAVWLVCLYWIPARLPLTCSFVDFPDGFGLDAWLPAAPTRLASTTYVVGIRIFPTCREVSVRLLQICC
jgi:hypothetical protein